MDTEINIDEIIVDVAGKLLTPQDVLASTELSTAEKRALIASWASDRNAVADKSTLRRTPDGSFIELTELLRALGSLDVPDRSYAGCWRVPTGSPGISNLTLVGGERGHSRRSMTTILRHVHVHPLGSIVPVKIHG
jgi:hypothetical protein